METKPKAQPQTEAAVPETQFDLDFLKNEDNWDELDDFDYEDWDENFNKDSIRSSAVQEILESKDMKKQRNCKIEISQQRQDQVCGPSFPSFSDIQKSLEIVRKAFPETFTDQVIDKLFQHLMDKMNNPLKRMPSPKVLPKQTITRQNLYSMKSLANSQKIRPRQKSFSNFEMPPPPPRKLKLRQQDKFPGGLLSFPSHATRKDKEYQIPNPQKGIAERLDKIWTQQFQEILLNLYKKGNQFSFIRDHFQQQYPQHNSKFTVNSLRGRFYKVIRQTVRKLYTFIDKIGREYFPRMIKLSYTVIQSIMYVQEARDLRCLLIDLYFSDKPNKTLIDRIIQAILRFINETKNMENKKRRPEN